MFGDYNQASKLPVNLYRQQRGEVGISDGNAMKADINIERTFNYYLAETTE